MGRRPFQIHSGAGGLTGVAARLQRAATGANNARNLAWQQQSPVVSSGKGGADGIIDTPPPSALLAGLGAYWPLEDQSWLDVSGGGHPLLETGTVPNVAGKIEAGAGFSGVAANSLRRESPDNFTFTDTVNGFSYQVWVRLKSLAVDQSIIGNMKMSGTPHGWRLMYSAAENGFGGNTADSDIPGFENNISDVECILNQWHHVVYVFEVGNGTSAIYVDNIKRLDSNMFPFNTSGVDFVIGGDGGNGVTSVPVFPANADLDEIAIWPVRSLTEANVNWLWNGGAGRDFTTWT
jgi:hypothetical protein